MRFRGTFVFGVPAPCDAGFGRRIWMAANIEPSESVVDLGGTGDMVAWNPRRFAVDDLSGFGPGHRLNAPFLKGDVQALALPDRSFDVAVLAEVLEHLPDPVAGMREAGRVASRVLITTPLEARWKNGLGYRVPGHIRYYTTEILTTQLRRAGLDGDLSILEFGHWSFFVAVVAADHVPHDRALLHVAP